MRAVKKRRVVKITKIPGPAKQLVNKISRATATRKAAEAAAKAEADRILQGGITKGLKVLTPQEIAAMKANPTLARMVNEEAAVQAAAAYGVNIRNAKGKIDMKLARKAAEAAAIQSAAEMGFDITDKRGKINRRKAMEAARAAEEARAGKPVSAQVAAAVSRQDALIIAALDAAQRRGTSAVVPAGNASRREAYTDAELAALVRRTIQETIS